MRLQYGGRWNNRSNDPRRPDRAIATKYIFEYKWPKLEFVQQQKETRRSFIENGVKKRWDADDNDIKTARQRDKRGKLTR